MTAWEKFEVAVESAKEHTAYTDREKKRRWYLRLREDPKRWAARKAMLRRRRR